MNVTTTTTGQNPLVPGSTETFVFSGMFNGQPWNLAGGSGSLKIKDPNGTVTVNAVTISGARVTYTWTVGTTAGTWTRAWFMTDANGVVENTPPITFTVIASP